MILVISIVMFPILLIRMLLILFVAEHDVIVIVDVRLNRIKLQQLNIDQPLLLVRLYSEFSRDFVLARGTGAVYVVRVMLMMLIMPLIIPVVITRILIVLKERLVPSLLLVMIVRSVLVALVCGMRVRMLMLLMIGLVVRECRHHVIRSEELWPSQVRVGRLLKCNT